MNLTSPSGLRRPGRRLSVYPDFSNRDQSTVTESASAESRAVATTMADGDRTLQSTFNFEPTA
jgi:hypothetical protein